ALSDRKLQNANEAANIRYHLAAIAPEKSFPVLVQSLQKEDAVLRAALRQVEKGATAEETCGQLLKDFRNGDADARFRAAHALWQLMPLVSEQTRDKLTPAAATSLNAVVPQLIKVLETGDAPARRTAVATLVRANSLTMMDAQRVAFGEAPNQKLRDAIRQALEK